MGGSSARVPEDEHGLVVELLGRDHTAVEEGVARGADGVQARHQGEKHEARRVSQPLHPGTVLAQETEPLRQRDAGEGVVLDAREPARAVLDDGGRSHLARRPARPRVDGVPMTRKRLIPFDVAKRASGLQLAEPRCRRLAIGHTLRRGASARACVSGARDGVKEEGKGVRASQPGRAAVRPREHASGVAGVGAREC